MNEYKTLSKEPWTHIELVNDNIFHWKVALIVLNPDSVYHGGYFVANMKFPQNYPYSPPDFKFKRTLYHPNVYEDGRLCISILHAPGDDEMSGESGAIRWSPAQRVESVLLSIMSLLDDANVSSPANVDASVMYRDKPEDYKKMVEKDLEASKADIPAGFVMPTTDAYNSKKDDNADFMDDWGDSDAELDFDEDDSGVDDEDMEVDDASQSGEDEDEDD